MANIGSRVSRLVAVCAVFLCACGGVDDVESSDGTPSSDGLEAETQEGESELGTVESSDGTPSDDGLATEGQEDGAVEKNHCGLPFIWNCTNKCIVVSSTNRADCCCICNGAVGKYSRSAWSPTTYVCQ